MKSSGKKKRRRSGPGAVPDGPSVAVGLVLPHDLGRGHLAGGPLPQLVDQLAGQQHHHGAQHAERDPLEQLAGLLRGTLGELGHLVLHLLAGLLYLAGGGCRGFPRVISSFSSLAVVWSSALAFSGATLEAARRFLPTRPSTATTMSS